jgi:adenylate cyclase
MGAPRQRGWTRIGKNLWRILLGLALLAVALLHSAAQVRLAPLERLEALLYDARLALTAPGGVDPRIVIVDIDERSLRERESGGEGRWPWSRDRVALLLDQLFDHYQVAVVGFDVVFAERDETSGVRVLDTLAQTRLKGSTEFQQALREVRPTLDYDQTLARAMAKRPVVLGYTLLRGQQGAARKGALPVPLFDTHSLPLTLSDVTRWHSYTGNLALLQQAAAGAGHFNPLPDADGVVRRVPMLAEFEGGYYESLSLAMLRQITGNEPLQALLAEGANAQTFGGLEALAVGSLQIPVDEQLAALVPYRGPAYSFAYLSAADIMRGQLPKEALAGKLVLVGTSAPGLLDLRATPLAGAYPGVEIHANLLAGMLDGTVKQKPPFVRGVDLVTLLVAGGLLAIALPLLGPLWASLTTLAATTCVLGLNLLAWSEGLVLPLATVLVLLVLLYVVNMGWGFFFEARSRRQITGRFGQYVPQELVEEMAQNPENFSMDGESRELTILFSDVRGFTTISESLDPKQLALFMNAFLTAFSQIIYKHRGTIDKYMGDCIMAFWGAPMPDQDHARHAMRAALDMVDALDQLKQEFRTRGWPEIKIGIGLNTGRVSVGNMGSTVRVAYTVMGDAVNLASRLEGITKEYGVQIIIGEQTRSAVPDLICRELDKVRVKGKDIAVAIHEPLGFAGEVAEATLAAARHFEVALMHYRAQRWEDAEAVLRSLLRDAAPTGEKLYTLYLERIALLRANPPGPAWDGAFTFQTK